MRERRTYCHMQLEIQLPHRERVWSKGQLRGRKRIWKLWKEQGEGRGLKTRERGIVSPHTVTVPHIYT
jgi:hypothetical protein